MHRRLDGDKIVLASHNEGKVREIGELLKPYGMDVLSAKQLNLPEPDEPGLNFTANAILKARPAAQASKLPALADDSGLCVTALGGAPGIHSARWAGEARDFRAAMDRVESLLRQKGATGPNERRAEFVCALAVAWPDGYAQAYLGSIDGALVYPPRGTQGFGYDPVFMPDGYDETFGEMDPGQKHRISHRARAFAQLVAMCFPP